MRNIPVYSRRKPSIKATWVCIAVAGLVAVLAVGLYIADKIKKLEQAENAIQALTRTFKTTSATSTDRNVTVTGYPLCDQYIERLQLFANCLSTALTELSSKSDILKQSYNERLNIKIIRPEDWTHGAEVIIKAPLEKTAGGDLLRKVIELNGHFIYDKIMKFPIDGSDKFSRAVCSLAPAIISELYGQRINTANVHARTACKIRVELACRGYYIFTKKYDNFKLPWSSDLPPINFDGFYGHSTLEIDEILQKWCLRPNIGASSIAQNNDTDTAAYAEADKISERLHRACIEMTTVDGTVDTPRRLFLLVRGLDLRSNEPLNTNIAAMAKDQLSSILITLDQYPSKQETYRVAWLTQNNLIDGIFAAAETLTRTLGDDGADYVESIRASIVSMVESEFHLISTGNYHSDQSGNKTTDTDDPPNNQKPLFKKDPYGDALSRAAYLLTYGEKWGAFDNARLAELKADIIRRWEERPDTDLSCYQPLKSSVFYQKLNSLQQLWIKLISNKSIIDMPADAICALLDSPTFQKLRHDYQLLLIRMLIPSIDEVPRTTLQDPVYAPPYSINQLFNGEKIIELTKALTQLPHDDALILAEAYCSLPPVYRLMIFLSGTSMTQAQLHFARLLGGSWSNPGPLTAAFIDIAKAKGYSEEKIALLVRQNLPRIFPYSYWPGHISVYTSSGPYSLSYGGNYALTLNIRPGIRLKDEHAYMRTLPEPNNMGTKEHYIRTLVATQMPVAQVNHDAPLQPSHIVVLQGDETKGGKTIATATSALIEKIKHRFPAAKLQHIRPGDSIESFSDVLDKLIQDPNYTELLLVIHAHGRADNPYSAINVDNPCTPLTPAAALHSIATTGGGTDETALKTLLHKLPQDKPITVIYDSCSAGALSQ